MRKERPYFPLKVIYLLGAYGHIPAPKYNLTPSEQQGTDSGRIARLPGIVEFQGISE